MYKVLRLSGFPRVREGRLPRPEEFSDSQPQAGEVFPGGEGSHIAKGNITDNLIGADVAPEESTMCLGDQSAWKAVLKLGHRSDPVWRTPEPDIPKPE